MVATVLRWAGWGLAVIAGWAMLQSMFAQVELQPELNAAMSAVQYNVRRATELTRGTAAAMAPLKETSGKLGRINGQIRIVVSDLRDMNKAMEGVIASQEGIRARLESVNSRTHDVVTALGSVNDQNKAMLGVTGQVGGDTANQGESLRSLSAMTARAIDSLHAVNRRFAFLKRF